MTKKTDFSGRDPHAAGEVLKGILEQAGFDRQARRFSVFDDWPEMVGARLAAHSQPLRMRGDVLEVRVDHAIWIQQLQWRKAEILKKINARLENDPIGDIFWRFGMIKPAASVPESE